MGGFGAAYKRAYPVFYEKVAQLNSPQKASTTGIEGNTRIWTIFLKKLFK